MTLPRWRSTATLVTSLPELNLRWVRAGICFDLLTTVIAGPNKIVVLRHSTSTPWQSTPWVTFLQELPAEFSARQMTATTGATSAAGSYLPAAMFGRWQSIPEAMCLLEPLVAEYSAACNRRRQDLLPHRGLAHHHGLARPDRA